MSLQFSDLTNFKGLVQQYEKEIGANRGDISGNTNKLKEFTAEANLALDDYFAIGIQATGKWKLDDSNHSDYPEIYADLAAGQRGYTFTDDETGNLVLDIYRVYAKETGGVYKLLTPVDPDSEQDLESLYDGANTQGVPTRYDKTANSLQLDSVPSTSVTAGLRVSINREASYFTYTDETKKAGVPGLHHKYFFLKPALDFARRNGMQSLNTLEAEIIKMEKDIKEYFDRRDKDESNVMGIFIQNNK